MAGIALGATLVIACTGPAPTVTIPPDAPASIAAFCYWSADTPLSFAGWATLGQLGMPASGGLRSGDRVFAVVTRDRISQPTQGGGPPIVGRGLCIAYDDGSVGVSAVAVDWRL